MTGHGRTVIPPTAPGEQRARIAELERLVVTQAERIHAQSEQLAKCAEKNREADDLRRRVREWEQWNRERLNG